MILGFLRGTDTTFPFELRMLDRSIESVVAMIDDARSPEVQTFLTAIQDDQGEPEATPYRREPRGTAAWSSDLRMIAIWRQWHPSFATAIG